ncbi:hypothetical protein TCAL_16920 [Tigriopus californicus]|uniref:Uncharacterized protein n=1 Tax=Tigriopus californicus TaxID=6832 RepID=A0A553P872_TIGCA|nr:hypothetical protein TCAL_16920 [Tigriopus californicus]
MEAKREHRESYRWSSPQISSRYSTPSPRGLSPDPIIYALALNPPNEPPKHERESDQQESMSSEIPPAKGIKFSSREISHP